MKADARHRVPDQCGQLEHVAHGLETLQHLQPQLKKKHGNNDDLTKSGIRRFDTNLAEL